MEALLREYIEQFDSFHLFFLQPEVEAIQKHFGSTLAFYIKQGNLYPAFDIFNQFKIKIAERVDWIENRIYEPFDFEAHIEFAPDRRKLSWPQTLEEANVLWEHRLQYDIINEILGETKDPIQPQDLFYLKHYWPTGVMQRPENYFKLLITAYLDSIYWSTVPLIYDFNDESKREAIRENLDFWKNYEHAKKTILTRYKRLESNLLDFDTADIAEVFLSELARQYDPHSSFLSADTTEEFSINIRNSLVGIGAVLSEEEGYCVIRELIAGGPAAQSKLLSPGDSIVGIAQGNGPMVDVIGLNLRKTVRFIRGKKGTTVRLLIRPGAGDPAARKIVSLVRDEVEITTSLAQAELFTIPSEGKDYKIGVIEIPAFYGDDPDGKVQTSTTKDVEELIKKLKDKGAEGIIIDIRYNGGGLLNEAISLTGLFIKTGPVLQARDSFGSLSEFLDLDPNIAWEGPLIVLISRYSASASEIFAGALKDHNRALLVGDPATHGKGTVQAVIEIDRSRWNLFKKMQFGSIKITFQKWYRFNGESTQLKGVPSDIILPSIHPFLPIGESDIPHALEWDSIHPFLWTSFVDYQLSDALKNDLLEKSLIRQKESPDMRLLSENIQRTKARNDQKLFSINFKSRLHEWKGEKIYRERLNNQLETATPKFYTSEKILLDAALKAKKATTDETLEDPIDAFEDAAFKTKKIRQDIHLNETLRIMKDWLQS